jgi:uncharacterized delta-60 repeat protein
MLSRITNSSYWYLILALVSGFLSASAFAQSPTVTSLSTYSGKPGDSVTLSGANFDALSGNNLVRFATARASVSSASNNTLSVSVPLGATYGPVSVQIPNGKMGFSSRFFLPTFSPSGPITDHSFGQAQFGGDPSVPSDVTLSTGFSSPTQGVVVADFNGDGKSDIAVANWNNGNVVIFKNQGTGGSIINSSFVIAATISVGATPTDIAVGDLNGDGLPDLVVANWNANSISVIQNTSSGGNISFAPAVEISLINYYQALPPSSVAVADIDGDGWPDIVVSGQNPAVLRNRGLGGSIGSSSFDAPVTVLVSGGAAYDLAVADVDGDGKPDLLVTGYPNQCSVIHNKSTSGSVSFDTPVQLATASSYNGGVAIADLNGDGKPELIVGSGTLSIFPNQSTPGTVTTSSFGPRVDVAVRSSIFHLSVADLNGDGLPDIVATNGGVQIFINSGAASLASSFLTSVQLNIPSGTAGTGQYGRAAIADLNGDGKPDLVVDGPFGTIAVSQNLVQPLTATSISVSPGSGGVTVPWFKTLTLTAKQIFSDGSAQNVTQAAQWSSADSSIATVVNGQVTGVASGTVSIGATYNESQAASSITVTPISFATKAPGYPDGRFLPNVANGGQIGAVKCLAIQSDSKVIIGGLFSSINGVPRNNLARLNSDGTVDLSFNPGAGPNGSVESVALDSSGDILLVGRFTSVNGNSRRFVARVYADGTFDSNFDAKLSPSSTNANVVVVRPTGQILLGGNNLQITGNSAFSFLFQLNSTGAKDTTFQAASLSSGEVNSLELQADGKLLIGGSFYDSGSKGLFCLERLNSDGAFDTGFNIGIQTSRVYGIAVQSDGRIVVVGDFSFVFGNSIHFITRLQADGTLDGSFSSPASTGWGIVKAVAIQKNGKIVVTKFLQTVRLTSGGSLDSTYNSNTHPDWDIYAISVSPDEKIWTAGGITTVNGTPTMGVARLYGDITTFPGWQTEYFTQQELANPVNTGATGDFVGDGVTNLMKYALGLNPHSTALGHLPTSFVTSDQTGSFVNFTFQRLAQTTDIAFDIGLSYDLQQWDYSGSQLDQVGSPVLSSDGQTEQFTVRLRSPISQISKAFFDLRVRSTTQ